MPSIEIQAASPPDDRVNPLLSTLYARSNQLTAEMGAYFEDLASFNKYCVNLENANVGQQDGQTMGEPLETSITASAQKIEVSIISLNVHQNR